MEQELDRVRNKYLIRIISVRPCCQFPVLQAQLRPKPLAPDWDLWQLWTSRQLTLLRQWMLRSTIPLSARIQECWSEQRFVRSLEWVFQSTYLLEKQLRTDGPTAPERSRVRLSEQTARGRIPQAH
jgi:hypothetical protein